MKLICMCTITATLLSMLGRIVDVSADIMVQVIFNRGEFPTATTSCSERDNEAIDHIFGLVRRTRHLRSNVDNVTSVVPRELASYPAKCRRTCAGYIAGTCRATNCKGYRRTLRNEYDQQHDIDRELQSNSSVCTSELKSIQTKLDELISKNIVSATCKTFLNSTTRSGTCTSDIVFGEIERLRFWNAGNQTLPSGLWNAGNQTLSPVASVVVSNFTSGYSFCKSSKFNIEAITNDCVRTVDFKVTGPNQYSFDRHEMATPFTMFMDVNNVMTFKRVREVGKHYITVIPDGVLAKKKQYHFTVLNC